MPKKYSAEFLVELNSYDEEKMGVKLAKACVNADLPITEIAKVFGVSRMTIHSWFRGSPIRENNQIRIKQFLKALDEAWQQQLHSEKGDLPVSDWKQARSFLEEHIIPKLA
jgi:hypothetical protein